MTFYTKKRDHMESINPDIITITPDIEKLKKSSFTLQEKFLDPFFDPLPKGIGKYVFLLFIVFTITNIFAAFVLLIYYLRGPRRARKSRPRKDIAEEWFWFAERCLKYSYKPEIMEGYTRALELEPENGQILLRYNQFLASEFVQNKTPATGKPVGIIKTVKADNPYKNFKELLDGWRSSHPNEVFHNPIKPKKIEHLYSLGAWLAFDTKNFTDCIEFAEYSLTIGEFTDSKKDKEEKIELLILLSCALIIQQKQNESLTYLLQAFSLSTEFNKSMEAMAWELLGECFRENKKEKTAEYCYVLAQKKDSRRWISAYRLFRYYAKMKDHQKSSFYKSRYVAMQKELAPL